MPGLQKALERIIPRGERRLVPMGLGVLLLLIAAMLSSMWWAGDSQRHILQARRQSEITGVAVTLAEAVKPFLAKDDLAPLRRLFLETREAFALSDCRLRLPDGRVIADGEPSRITAATLPARWGTGPLDAQLSAPTSGDVFVNAAIPVLIPSRGLVTVEIAGPVSYPAWSTSEMEAGLSLIGAACVGGSLMLYRRLRSRGATLELIHESLAAAAGGERAPDVLCLDGTFGPEAKAYNALIQERDELQRSSLAAKARDLLGSRTSGGAELESAVGALAEGMVVLTHAGKVRYANGAACVFLGVGPDIITGTLITSHTRDLRLQQALEQVFSGKDRQRRVVEVEEKSAERRAVLRYEIRPMRGSDADEVMLVIHDVTQQRVADESRNAFVAHVTHELRTPLTTIRLYLETLADDGENDPAMRAKCLNVITQESRRLEHVVSEMLSVAEIEAGAMTLKWDDVRLDALFAGLKADYDALANEKKIQLAFELPPKLPVVRADRDRLAVALHNLLGNAIKYTPAGGIAKLSAKINGKTLQIDVSDTGLGIEESEHEKVFDRFYRSKDPRVHKITGTGLGLPMAREIARLHGGDITLQSQLNAGSIFTLTLPAAGEP